MASEKNPIIPEPAARFNLPEISGQPNIPSPPPAEFLNTRVVDNFDIEAFLDQKIVSTD